VVDDARRVVEERVNEVLRRFGYSIELSGGGGCVLIRAEGIDGLWQGVSRAAAFALSGSETHLLLSAGAVEMLRDEYVRRVLEGLTRLGVRVYACALSLADAGIRREELPSFVDARFFGLNLIARLAGRCLFMDLGKAEGKGGEASSAYSEALLSVLEGR